MVIRFRRAVPVGRESAAPPADPFHGATRRMTQGPQNNRGGGCAAGENDRREALAFPPYGVHQRSGAHAQASRRPAPQENHHDANDATECDGPAVLPEERS
jgi:hypothetical protein